MPKEFPGQEKGEQKIETPGYRMSDAAREAFASGNEALHYVRDPETNQVLEILTGEEFAEREQERLAAETEGQKAARERAREVQQQHVRDARQSALDEAEANRTRKELKDVYSGGIEDRDSSQDVQFMDQSVLQQRLDEGANESVSEEFGYGEEIEPEEFTPSEPEESRVKQFFNRLRNN